MNQPPASSESADQSGTAPSPAGTPLATHLLALAGYLLLSLVMTWPVADGFKDYVISEQMDAVTAFYNPWWFHHALVDLHASPWTSPLIDYPFGYSLVLFPIWFPYDLLALPAVHWLGAAGLPMIFNVISLLSLAASGYAMFVFVLYLTRRPGAAFVSGLALALMPFRIWNLTRWHVTCFEFLVPCLYFFLRMTRERSRGSAAGFVIFSCLLFYTSLNYAADLALALAVLLVLLLLAERETRSGQTFKLLAAAAIMVALLCSPLLVRLAMEAVGRRAPLFQEESLRLAYSANLAGFALPGFNLKSYAWLIPRVPYADPGLGRAHGIAGYEIFAGYTMLALAVAGAWARPREARPYLVLAAFFLALSLGPALHFSTHTWRLPMPFQGLEPVLPWLRLDRTPVRHSALVFISVFALAGLGLAAVADRLRGWRRAALLATAGAAVLLEFNQAPLKLDRIPAPGFTAAMTADPVPGSVLELPYLPIIKRFAGYTQPFHGRPLAIQLTSRIDDPAYQARALFKYLDRPRLWSGFSGEERARALAELRAEMALREIRYVVVYPKFMEERDFTALRQVLKALRPEQALVNNELYLVYRYGPWTGQSSQGP